MKHCIRLLLLAILLLTLETLARAEQPVSARAASIRGQLQAANLIPIDTFHYE